MIRKALLLAFILFSAISVSADLPAASLKGIDGKSVDTSQLNNNGKPFIIDFWATWCRPCVSELKAISDVYDSWINETGVKIYAVSIDDAESEQRVKQFIEKKGWQYDVLLDPNGEFKNLLGVTDPPHVFVVDGEGNVVWSHQGYVSGNEHQIIEAVRSIVK